MLSRNITSGGKVSTNVIRSPLNKTGSAWELFKATFPTNSYQLKNYKNIVAPLVKIAIANTLHIPTFYGVLFAKKTASDGIVTDYGIVSLKSVTTAGVKEVTDEMADGISELSSFVWHGIGTGAGAEAVSDSTLTGSPTRVESTDGASITVIPNATYTTSATHVAAAAIAVTEHGLFAGETTGPLFDRSLFSIINLSANDSLSTTYSAQFSSGG